MPITSDCGPHCGSANGTEGHCGCPECDCPQAVRVLRDIKLISWGPDDDSLFPRQGVPMCDRWYERAGDHRPWHKASTP